MALRTLRDARLQRGAGLIRATLVPASHDTGQHSLAFRQILKVDHAAKIQLTQLLRHTMFTQIQPYVGRIPRNRLLTNIDNNLAAKEAVFTGRDAFETPARRSIYRKLPCRESENMP